MLRKRIIPWLVMPVLVGGLGAVGWAADGASTSDSGETTAATTSEEVPAESASIGDDGPPVFSDAYLADATHIESGEEIWKEQCTHCHGAKAYPGKAPKLKPRKYEAKFVFDRVHDGFRKMPAWKDVYTREEIMAVTAYVMSDKFSP